MEELNIAVEDLQYLVSLVSESVGSLPLMGEAERPQAPPAAKDAVEALERKKMVRSGPECTVCLKQLTQGEVATIMPCTHAFHEICIVTWLGKTNSCPLCRFELRTDCERYEGWKKEQEREKQRVHNVETIHNSMFS